MEVGAGVGGERGQLVGRLEAGPDLVRCAGQIDRQVGDRRRGEAGGGREQRGEAVVGAGAAVAEARRGRAGRGRGEVRAREIEEAGEGVVAARAATDDRGEAAAGDEDARQLGDDRVGLGHQRERQVREHEVERRRRER